MAVLLFRLRSNFALKLAKESINTLSFANSTAVQCRSSLIQKLYTSNLISFSPVCFFTTDSRCFAKKEIPFKYVREKKIECIWLSGDNEGLPHINLNEPCLKYKDCKELESAPDDVKKIVSVGYSLKNELVRRQRWEMMRKLQKHEFDTGSTEATVAALTVKIRNLQDHMRRNCREKKGKVVLKEAIDARKKTLKKLRRQDYLRFEWLLKELNITYHPPPTFYHWTTRKGTLRVMTRNHCDAIRKARIEAFKAKLKAQQAEFLKKKEETLSWIEKEEVELGVASTDKETAKAIHNKN